MGNSESIQISPEKELSDVMETQANVCITDEAALFIGSTKTIELHQFSGNKVQKELNLQPTSCCSTYAGGFILGFKSGQISEFDKDLNVIRSFFQKSKTVAHNGEVTYLHHIFAPDENSCHLVSYGTDNQLCLWNKNGRLIHNLSVKPTKIVSSEMSIFFMENPTLIQVLDVESLHISKLKIHLPVVGISPISEGKGALICLDNGCVCLISQTKIIAQFEFPELNKAVEILPLTIEEPTGLITYLVKDTENQLTIRALDEVIFNFGPAPQMYVQSPTFLLAGYEDGNRIYRTGDLEAASMVNLPDLNLPRYSISLFFKQ